MADDDDELQQEVEASPPKYPFDVNTMECVLDMRALCGLPQDPEEDGVLAFRALLLPKGKTLHVPDEPGCYATLGPWRMQTALSTVHFVSATSRQPELLLAFVDFGMLSNGASTGIFVMSLQLPLSKARNVFEETPRFTKIADVSGFSSINAKEQPWCAMLEPALKRQPLFEGNKLYTPADIVSHLKVPLATRIKGLLATARGGIEAKVAALARQDARQSEKVKAKLTAQLDKANEWLQSLPPQKYDRTTADRITVVQPGEADGVAWLTSPQRGALRSGSAECKPTARAIRHPEAPAPPPLVQLPQLPTAPATATREPELSEEEDSDVVEAEFDQEPPDDLETPPPEVGAKRARKAPTHFNFPQPDKAARKAAKQAKVGR